MFISSSALSRYDFIVEFFSNFSSSTLDESMSELYSSEESLESLSSLSDELSSSADSDEDPTYFYLAAFLLSFINNLYSNLLL